MRALPDRRSADLVARPAGDAIVLDTHHLRWLSPLHLVMIAALADHAQTIGSWLHLRGPHPEARSYASRMGIGRVVDRFCGRHDLPAVNSADHGDSLLEVVEVESAADAERWAELVHHRVTGVSDRARHALHQGLAEIGENVNLHSQARGYVAAQTSHSSGQIRFAVADAGVGLRSTLAARGATSDARALHLALDGVSRLDGAAHGTGLSSTWEGIAAVGGHTVLVSHGAAVAQQARTDEPRFYRAEFPGTAFEGCVPAHVDRRGR